MSDEPSSIEYVSVTFELTIVPRVVWILGTHPGGFWSLTVMTQDEQAYARASVLPDHLEAFIRDEGPILEEAVRERWLRDRQPLADPASVYVDGFPSAEQAPGPEPDAERDETGTGDGDG